MTTNTRTEARLPEILEELYLGRTPDYQDEVVTTAVRTRQRPWWTFPGRWLPMADIVSRPAYAPRLPWRTITVALLIGALLLAAAVAYIGSRQPRVPLPFGVADNGVIAYAADGDIWTADPVTGVTTAVVTGTPLDSAPMFSPDGMRLAFEREVSIDGRDGVAIIVTSANGSNPIEISRGPAADGLAGLDWAPDSRSLLGIRPDSSEIVVLDATLLGEPRIVATDADLYSRPYQPPDGDAILMNRVIRGQRAMVRLDLATGVETVIATIGHGDLADARWSPDGSQVVVSSPPVTDQESRRLFLVNADGTGRPRQITSAPGTWWDIAPTWSPDGSRIAFLPYERVATDPTEKWDVRPIQVYSVADGSVVEVGSLLPRDIRAANPAPGDEVASAGEGWSFDWAPDGRSLIAFPSEGSGYALVIDAVTGEATTIDAVVTPISANQVWQRIAR
jgi:Tol biopolymer transport system component